MVNRDRSPRPPFYIDQLVKHSFLVSQRMFTKDPLPAPNSNDQIIQRAHFGPDGNLLDLTYHPAN